MTNVYNIAVKIGMANGVSSVLRVIQKDLFGLNRTVDLTSKKFRSLAVVAGGAMTAIAGTAALKGMAKIIVAGDKIIQQQQKLRELGLSANTVTGMTGQAFSTATSTPGLSASQVMSLQNDLVRSLGSPKDAQAVLQSAVKATFALQQITGDISDSSILAAIKTVDVQGGAVKNGKIDPAEFTKNLNAMVAAITVSNGLLTPQQILQITRMAGPAAQGADFSSWIFSNLSAFMNMGRISGRGIKMAGRDLLAGYSSKVAAEEGKKLGLYGGDAITKDYNRYYIDPSKIVGGSVLTDPTQGIPAWVQQVLIPKLEANGFKSAQQMAGEIDKLIPDQSAQSYISQEVVAYLQEQRDASLSVGADGSNFYALSQQTLKAQMQDFTASWQSLIEALGMPMVRTAIIDMQGITAAINGFAEWAATHQTQVKIADATIVAVAAAMVVLGGVAVVTALAGMVGAGGTLALVCAGIIGLGAALTILKNDLPTLPKWLQAPKGTYKQDGTLAVPIVAPGTGGTRATLGQIITQDFLSFMTGQGNFLPPPPSQKSAPITLTGTVVLNGKKLGNIIATGLTAPNNGTTGVNLRGTPSGSAALQLQGAS